jgi:hypothetical protein
MMECYPRRGDAVITTYPDLTSPMDNWMGGIQWTTPVPEPLVFEIAEDEKGAMRPMLSTHFLLMSDPLVAALRQSGVDNIDVYTAVIRETDTGRTFDDYKAVNILGLVSAVDMAASEVVDLCGGEDDLNLFFFDRIALDEAKCRGALLFRLAEKTSAIVVDGTVKETLERLGFDRLEFFEPKDWNAG